jgi:hypothetical protein
LQAAPDFGTVDLRRPAFVDAARLGGGNAFGLAFAPQVGLEFGEDAEHVKKSLTGGGRGVDGLLGREQIRAFGFEPVHDHLQVTQGTGQPINAGDDERLAGVNEVENGGELGATVERGAALLLLADDLAAGGPVDDLRFPYHQEDCIETQLPPRSVAAPTEGMCGQARSKTGYLSEIVTSYQPIIRTGNAPCDVGRGGEGAASEPQQPALVAEAVERRSLVEMAKVTGQKRSVEAVVAAADKARQRSVRNVVHHTNRRASSNHRTTPNVHASPNRRANRLGTSRRRASLPLKRARQV